MAALRAQRDRQLESAEVGDTPPTSHPRPGARPGFRSGEAEVYRVACHIFRERGYHASSMRAIASALGMQPAALYYYFASKEDLLFSIMDTAIDALTERVLGAVDPHKPAAVQLEQAITAHITTVADHLDELSVFLHEIKSLKSERRTIVQDKRDRYERFFRRILRDGMNVGEFEQTDSRLAGFLILAACNWLYSWYRPDGGYSPEEIASSFSHMILRGLRTPLSQHSSP